MNYLLIPLRKCLHEAVVYSPLSTDLANPFTLSCQNKHSFTEINVEHNCALGQARHFLSEISSFLCFLEIFGFKKKTTHFSYVFPLISSSSPKYYQNLQLFSLKSEDGQKMARIPQMG